jgi:hypothetical protein
MANLSGLFRDSLLTTETALVTTNVDRSLLLVHGAMTKYATQLVDRIQRGTKEAFSVSITQMLGRANWIVLLGLLIVLFVPELPLRSSMTVAVPKAAGE